MMEISTVCWLSFVRSQLHWDASLNQQLRPTSNLIVKNEATMLVVYVHPYTGVGKCPN